MNIAIEAATEGKPELAFWPAVSFGYLYTQSNGAFWLVACVLLCLCGAPLYIVMKKAREAVEDAQKIGELRRRVERDNRRNNDRNQWTALFDIVFAQFPDNSRIRSLFFTVAC